MAKKEKPVKRTISAAIAGAGTIEQEPITLTLEKNYMPYAMSVIVSRAIPEIDGFKPSHRKILYTMYKMGLLSGARTKSANVVGQTMKLNPHGDQAIYETLVRLSRGYEALLHPYIDSKGNFGKVFSRDMAYAASRYTEVKLDAICDEIFFDIDHDTVDFADNYDSTIKEPVLLPVTFPSILVNANTGIAVGMASSICPFNLKEVCETAIALIKDPDHDILTTLKAPDFPGGGAVIASEGELRAIYETGRGSVKVRAGYTYDKSQNCIEVTQIPYTTTSEAIIDKIVELVKAGKIREISDVRDETDLSGLKLAIDLKRGVDPDKLMAKLYKMTPLEDSFSCNFNILISGAPKVMGVGEIIREWTAFRTECIRRGIYFDLTRKKERLHLLRGLERILLDIDKAVRIVRETDEEKEVVPNLMIGFGIDKLQAEYVAEIKLRHLNREYILNRTEEISGLLSQIADMEETLGSPKKVRAMIIGDLSRIILKFGKPRQTLIAHPVAEGVEEEEDECPDYPVNLFFTREGYFKKITPQSLRMSGEQKLKEGDSIATCVEASNRSELLFFTDKGQVYKARASEFDDTKASVMGDFIPAKLGMDQNESALYMVVTDDYSGCIVLFFQNGKALRIEMSSYATKTRRRKLTGAFSTHSPLVALFGETDANEYAMRSTAMKMLVLSSALIPLKQSRGSQGVQIMKLSKNAKLESVIFAEKLTLENIHRYKSRNLPAAGSPIAAQDISEQTTI